MSYPLDKAAVDQLLEAQVHVVGLAGTEGAAIVRFLAARGVRDLHAHDIQSGEALERSFMQVHVGLPKPEREAVWREIEGLDITLHTGADYLHGFDEADAIFASQGWYLYPANHPKLDHARDAGTPFYGLMHLYFGLAPARTLAVTGSNGKSTTSRLVEHILREAGMRVWYAGNERRSVQVLDRLDEMQPADILVLEVSNRHLIDLNPRPDIAVITNVLPNHLSEHGGSFDEYRSTKRRLIERQRADQVCILNADDPASEHLAEGASGRVMWFSRARQLDAGAWVEDGRLRLKRQAADSVRDGAVRAKSERSDDAAGDANSPHADRHSHQLALDAGPIDAMPVPGEHNIENMLAAALASWEAGADAAAIERAVPTFRGLRHRTQLVWSVDGVEYFDDLNATSPQATISALKALGQPSPSQEDPHATQADRMPPAQPALKAERRIVLICGGDEKGLDMSPLGEAIARYVRWLVLLPGPGSDEIERVARAVEDSVQPKIDRVDDSVQPKIDRVDDFATAVRRVMQGVGPGERVLLSPACPGFFSRNYGAP